MQHARKLYDDFGFCAIEPYDEKPHEGVLYGCLGLSTKDTPMVSPIGKKAQSPQR